MTGKAAPFVDTNILVYAIETGGPNPAKSSCARELLGGDPVCLSTQVLGEFYHAVTSPRRAQPLTHEQAVAWIQVWRLHQVRDITLAHVDLALEIHALAQIGYYDALILAAARLAECDVVYSEDLSSGQEIAGVRVQNPFPEDG
jgi:predicted nucleic acid-binding protein